MCSKYSNLADFRIKMPKRYINLKADNNELHMASQILNHQRSCAVLAFEAIHNVISLIDKDMLQLKAYGEELTPENSLGMETYNIMFKLGFWKKIVYISSIELGLQLTYTFCDLR